MIANYGYMDGSGQFFISIDTDKCATCYDKPCIHACPKGMFEKIIDDYDEEVVAIKEVYRKSLKYECAPCKPAKGWTTLPCIEACNPKAITHSW